MMIKVRTISLPFNTQGEFTQALELGSQSNIAMIGLLQAIHKQELVEFSAKELCYVQLHSSALPQQDLIKLKAQDIELIWIKFAREQGVAMEKGSLKGEARQLVLKLLLCLKDERQIEIELSITLAHPNLRNKSIQYVSETSINEVKEEKSPSLSHPSASSHALAANDNKIKCASFLKVLGLFAGCTAVAVLAYSAETIQQKYSLA